MEQQFVDTTAPPSYEEATGLRQESTELNQPIPSSSNPQPQSSNQEMETKSSLYQKNPTSHHTRNQYTQRSRVRNTVNRPQSETFSRPPRRIPARIIPRNTVLRSHSFMPLVVCHSCEKNVKLGYIRENNWTTHILAGVLCIMGCFICSWIPYFVDSCKTRHYYCTECYAYYGTYDSFSGARRYSNRHF